MSTKPTNGGRRPQRIRMTKPKTKFYGYRNKSMCTCAQKTKRSSMHSLSFHYITNQLQRTKPKCWSMRRSNDAKTAITQFNDNHPELKHLNHAQPPTER